MAEARVRVRTLGEFVFCPRAGLLSHASADEEDEPTDERMNLNFLPEYSLTLIEEQLAVQLGRLARWAAWAAGGFFLVVVAVLNELPPMVPLALAVPTVLCVRKSLHALSAVVTLGDRRRDALAATPAEPPADLADDSPVRWWDLLKAGFESVPYLEPLFDEDLNLAGKPWRVLNRGSLRIPVIRLPADNYHAGRYWVYEQHRVRLAAYARLLAACEGGQTPYAVVLFGGSYDGVAVPVIPGEAVRAQLDELRRTLDLDKMAVPTPLPANPEGLLGLPARAAPRLDRRGPQGRDARAKAARRHRAGRAGVPQRVRGSVRLDAAARSTRSGNGWSSWLERPTNRLRVSPANPAGVGRGRGRAALGMRDRMARAETPAENPGRVRPPPPDTRSDLSNRALRVEREAAGEKSVEGDDGGPGKSGRGRRSGPTAAGISRRRRPVISASRPGRRRRRRGFPG